MTFYDLMLKTIYYIEIIANGNVLLIDNKLVDELSIDRDSITMNIDYDFRGYYRQFEEDIDILNDKLNKIVVMTKDEYEKTLVKITRADWDTFLKSIPSDLTNIYVNRNGYHKVISVEDDGFTILDGKFSKFINYDVVKLYENTMNFVKLETI